MPSRMVVAQVQVTRSARSTRVYAPTLMIATGTTAVAWVGAATLAHDGALGRALAAGREELVGPSLVILVAAVLVCERLWPAERRKILARGHVQDACFFLLYATMVVPLMTLMGVAFAEILGTHASWLQAPWTASWPAWLVIGMTLVAMDFCNWLAHWADHRLAPLWRLHAVHHSQEEVSVLTSFRAHPIVHVTGFLLATVPVVALTGFHPLAPVLITAYLLLGTLTHANVPWNFGLLGRVFVSPAYHRVHHEVDCPPGANLGVVLTIWDVIAGRSIVPRGGRSTGATGLLGRPLAVEQGGERFRPLSLMATQLVEPFTSSAGSGEHST
jgi:sterol desaturase/sphingolipid hydroxylase (fatty acid hydroxylase superfamily)